MRELLRHFAFSALAFVLLIALMLGTYVWMAKSDSMKSAFSRTECEKVGGTWDEGVELCHHE